MAAFDSGNIDFSKLSATDIASLTPEQKTEYQRWQIEQRNNDIQAGIDASLLGDKVKLAELKAKMADGFATSKKLFNMWYDATDKMQSQANTVWSANKELTNVKYEHNIWSQADMAAQSYKKGNLSALDGFSDTRFGSPITDVGDTFQITNRENNISNRTYQLSESMTDKQAYYDEQQAVLAQNKKERAQIDSDLELQIWRNKMTADEQDYYTKLMAQLTLYKNQQD